MEEVFKIEGGHQLNGEVRISGAKNATQSPDPGLDSGQRSGNDLRRAGYRGRGVVIHLVRGIERRSGAQGSGASDHRSDGKWVNRPLEHPAVTRSWVVPIISWSVARQIHKNQNVGRLLSGAEADRSASQGL